MLPIITWFQFYYFGALKIDFEVPAGSTTCVISSTTGELTLLEWSTLLRGGEARKGAAGTGGGGEGKESASLLWRPTE